MENDELVAVWHGAVTKNTPNEGETRWESQDTSETHVEMRAHTKFLKAGLDFNAETFKYFIQRRHNSLCKQRNTRRCK